MEVQWIRNLGPDGPVGDIDAETPGAILEAKSGKTWDSDNTDQIRKLLTNPQLNPTGKPVIVYAPNFNDEMVVRVRAAGAIVVQNEEQVIEILKLYGQFERRKD